MRVEHIALNVQEPRAMAKWYTEHMGMHVAFMTESGFFLADASGHGIIEIYHNPSDPVPDYAAMPPCRLHIGFQTDHPAEDYHRLQSAGALAEGPPPAPDDSPLCYMLRDPWGLTLQLVKRKRPILPQE